MPISLKPSRVALAAPVSEAAALSIAHLKVVLVVAQIEPSLGYPLFDRTPDGEWNGMAEALQ